MTTIKVIDIIKNVLKIIKKYFIENNKDAKNIYIYLVRHHI